VWLAELKPVAVPKVDLDTQALFEAAKSNPPATFLSSDVVLAKRADMPKDQDHAAQIVLDLATIFDEADADKDGKLTLEEWHNFYYYYYWLEKEQLQKLFTECDTNGDGTLDKEEFTVGCANKYLIKWAQVVGDRMMFAVSPSTVPHLRNHYTTVRGSHSRAVSGSASACCSLRCAVLFRVVSLTLQNTVLIEILHDALAQEPQKENIKDATVVLPPAVAHTHSLAPCASEA
jgi:hypothetical protein